MIARVEHTDVGAYALGLLDVADALAFGEHLEGCPPCVVELAELEGVAAVLDRARPVVLLRRRAERRRRYGMAVAGMAAALALVTGGTVLGFAMDGGTHAVAAQHGAASPAAAQQGEVGGAVILDHAHRPAEAAYLIGAPIEGVGSPGVGGAVVLEAKTWGTHAVLRLAGVKGPLRCELVAVSRSGERSVVTGWAVPEPGYGVPGSPEPLYVHGGSALPMGDIDRFEVTTSAGDRLLTVKV